MLIVLAALTLIIAIPHDRYYDYQERDVQGIEDRLGFALESGEANRLLPFGTNFVADWYGQSKYLNVAGGIEYSLRLKLLILAFFIITIKPS